MIYAYLQFTLRNCKSIKLIRVADVSERFEDCDQLSKERKGNGVKVMRRKEKTCPGK